MTDKQAAQLEIDSRTYDPKKDVVEDIMKLVEKHYHPDIEVFAMTAFRKDLQAYIEKI